MKLPNYRIQPIHLSIVKDTQFLGRDIHTITDMDLLIEWWKASEWLNNTENTDYKTRQLKEFFAAVWIQLNLLHPKTLLKFDDIKTHEYENKVC